MTKLKMGITTQMSLVDEPGSFAKKNEHRITVSKSKAREVIRIMLHAYEMKMGRFKHIHHSTHGPQHVFVPGKTVLGEQSEMFEYTKRRIPTPTIVVGSLKHLQYLCLVTLTDRLQDSATLYANHCRLYADMPWVYSRKVLRLKREQLAAIFQHYKIGLPNENARFWLGVARTLFIDFDGDPVALFMVCGATVAGVQAWIKKYKREHGRNPLLGYKEKITSLYLLYLAELGALPFPKDAFAVDVHVIFQMYQTGVVTIHEKVTNTILAEVIRELICQVCDEEGFDKIALSNALWLNGNQGCDGCSENAAAPMLCPLWSKCLGRYSTDNYHHNGTIDPRDPLFPKGGEWPKFGFPQKSRRRPDVKGRGVIIVKEIKTLFDKK